MPCPIWLSQIVDVPKAAYVHSFHHPSLSTCASGFRFVSLVRPSSLIVTSSLLLFQNYLGSSQMAPSFFDSQCCSLCSHCIH
jgi:hypothetical protein